MKIAFLTNNPNMGSTARILKSWIQHCPENEIDPIVVGRSDGDFLDSLQNDQVRTFVDPMTFLDARRPMPGLWHGFRVAMRIGQVSIVHCNEHDVYPFVRSIGLYRSFSRVCHVRYKLDRGFAEWAFGGSHLPDAVLWTSHQQKADSADAVDGLVPAERQHVVRLGIDSHSFGVDPNLGYEFRKQWDIADDEILVGIPAPLRPRKRVHEFVELIRRLAPRHPKLIGLIAGGEIAGDEDYRHSIEKQINGSGLGRRLRWVGNLEPVEPFHHACDISISTSEYETFGNSVCEAMACGKPVVGYRGGSVAEVVGESGLVVPTGDLDALTRAVDGLVTNPQLRQQLGENARRRVESEFSPAASFQQLLGIYDSILRK